MKKLMLCLLLLSSVKISNGCGWWPEGDMIRFHLFQSDLAEGDDMSDLFYSPHVFSWYKVDEYTGPAENLEEWSNYFGNGIPVKDIDQFIYGKEMTQEEKGSNQLIQHFKSGNNKEAMEYLVFARLIQKQLDWDPWDKEMDVSGAEASEKFAKKKLEEVQDPIIKLRYAYQLVVLNYYLGDHKDIKFYYKEVILKSTEKTVIKSWAEFYYAHTLNYIPKFYHLAKVFDDSKSKNRYIYQHFPTDEKEVASILELCENDQERSAVLSLQAFKNPGRAKDQFKKVAELNPNNELTEILMIREINKMEDWYMSDRYIGFGSSVGQWSETFEFIGEENFKEDRKYLMSFRDVVAKIYKDNKIFNEDMWLTALAYMSYMLDDKSATEKYLKEANKITSDPQMKAQIAIIDVLHLIKHEDDWNEKFQENLMLGLKRVEDVKDDLSYYDKFYAEIMLVISRKFWQEGDLVLAALWEARVNGEDQYHMYSAWGEDQMGYQTFDMLDQNGSSKEMDALFEFWNKPNKTQTEEWLFEGIEPFRWRLTDLWGTAYFREDNLEQALEIYETIPDSVWQVNDYRFHYYYSSELDNDPFETNLIGRSYGGNASGKTYTKPEFIREILRLKKNLEGPSREKAYYAVLLGNAYYNMTHGGNSYYYTEYAWSHYESNSFPGRDQSYYYNAERALEYYELAESYAPNDTYAAFCYRLQLKCKRDSHYYNADDYDWQTVKKKEVEDWKVFAQKYPEHFKFLTNCDKYSMYSTAWQQG